MLLAEGASNKTIARRLTISVHTAKFHIASIIDKLDAIGPPTRWRMPLDSASSISERHAASASTEKDLATSSRSPETQILTIDAHPPGDIYGRRRACVSVSAYPPIASGARTSWIGSSVPISEVLATRR